MLSIERICKFLSENGEQLLHSVNFNTHLVLASHQSAKRASIVLVSLKDETEESNLKPKDKVNGLSDALQKMWGRNWASGTKNSLQPESISNSNSIEEDLSETLTNIDSIKSSDMKKLRKINYEKRPIFVFKPNEHIGTYCASINKLGNILAYIREIIHENNMKEYETTFIPIDHLTKRIFDNSKKYDLISESLNALNRGGKKYVSNNELKYHLQFVHDYKYIRFMSGGSIYLKEIETAIDRKTGLLQIKDHINLFVLVRNWFFWSSWNSEQEVLYVLEPKNKMINSNLRRCERNSKELKYDCIFKCFDIPSLVNVSQTKQKSRYFEYSLSVSISRSAIPFENSHKKEGWDDIRSYSHRDLKMQVIHLDQDSICICQQHTLIEPYQNYKNEIWSHGNFNIHDNSDSKFIIPVTIHAINHKKEIRIDIPISKSLIQFNRSSDDLSTLIPSAPNVIFSSCDQLVIVFVPEVYLEIIDLHPNHEPISIVKINELDKLPTFPIRSSSISLNNIKSLQKMDFSSQLLLPSKGYLFKWKFSKEYILNEYIPKLNILEDSLSLLHFLLAHMRYDNEFIRMVLIGMFKKQLFLGEILAEYIIEMSFFKISEKIQDKTLLQLIPSSLMEKYFPSSLDVRSTTNLLNDIMGRLNKRTPIIFLLDLIPSIRANDLDVRRKILELKNLANNKNSNQQRQNTRPLFSLLNIFTSPRKDEEIKEILPNDEISYIMRQLFNTNVLNVLSKHAPSKTLEKIPKFSSDYCSLIDTHCNLLYELIQEYMGVGKVQFSKRGSKSDFSLNQGMYQCLELTGFPPPNKFSNEFAISGLKVLPRKVFIDYVNRDVFWITEDLVSKLCNESKESGYPADEYLGIIIRKIHHMKTELKLFEEMKDGVSQILSYYSNKLYIPKDFISSPEFQNMILNASNFDTFEFMALSWKILDEQAKLNTQNEGRAVEYKVNYLNRFCSNALKNAIEELNSSNNMKNFSNI